MSHDSPESTQDPADNEPAALVDAFAGPLTRYARSLCGNLEIARDAVQETFLRYFRKIPPPARAIRAAWLFKVCRTRVIDQVRKEGRMSTADPADLPPVIDEAPAPADVMETHDSTRVVLHCLDTLPNNQREVVRLKFQNGLSYKEIADVTQLSVSNVGFLLHTGLKALRTKLATQTDLLS